MKKISFIPLFVSLLFLFGCENFVKNDEIESIISKNDINIKLEIDNTRDSQIQKVLDNEEYVEIIVANEFTIRGKTEIEIGKSYKLSITLKNLNAAPVILYSFWKEPVTSTRNYTLAGENGNPPKSKTQEQHSDWVTFDEYFEAKEGEDSFMLTIYCTAGTFCIKNIEIEEVKK